MKGECPLCTTKLTVLKDGSGALCPQGHFGTNVESDWK